MNRDKANELLLAGKIDRMVSKLGVKGFFITTDTASTARAPFNAFTNWRSFPIVRKLTFRLSNDELLVIRPVVEGGRVGRLQVDVVSTRKQKKDKCGCKSKCFTPPFPTLMPRVNPNMSPFGYTPVNPFGSGLGIIGVGTGVRTLVKPRHPNFYKPYAVPKRKPLTPELLRRRHGNQKII